jgi:hypothetical protein
MNTFGKLAGYQINMKKSVAFQINNEQAKKEIRKASLVTKASKKMK